MNLTKIVIIAILAIILVASLIEWLSGFQNDVAFVCQTFFDVYIAIVVVLSVMTISEVYLAQKVITGALLFLALCVISLILAGIGKTTVPDKVYAFKEMMATAKTLGSWSFAGFMGLMVYFFLYRAPILKSSS